MGVRDGFGSLEPAAIEESLAKFSTPRICRVFSGGLRVRDQGFTSPGVSTAIEALEKFRREEGYADCQGTQIVW